MRTAGMLIPMIIVITLPAAEQASPPAADAQAKSGTETTAIPVAEPPAKPVIEAPAKPAADPLSKPAAEGTVKLLPEITQMLNDQLPKYIQPAPAKPEATPDPDVLQLPKMTVTQKKRPRLGDDVMMTSAAFNDKLAKEKTSSFDRFFLNKYNWLGGATAAERAREEYDYEQREKLQSDVARMAKVVDQINPAQAKALRDAASKP